MYLTRCAIGVLIFIGLYRRRFFVGKCVEDIVGHLMALKTKETLCFSDVLYCSQLKNGYVWFFRPTSYYILKNFNYTS